MSQKNTALILGGTGLIGKELVKILCERYQYEKIHLIVRRPIETDYNVCETHVIDFEELHKYPELFKVNHVFCCLGTTIKKAKTKDAFRKVDFDFPVKAAKLAKENGAEKYLIVTAMGANSKSIIFYNQVKGDVEEALMGFHLSTLQIFRPSLLLGDREEFRIGEKIGEKVIGIVNVLMVGPWRKYRGIQAIKVAEAMAVVANTDKIGTNVYLSHEIERMTGTSVSKRV